MKTKYPNHRIWFFINHAKETGQDSIDFYHPVSSLANKRYEELKDNLNELGYVAKSMSNPKGNSLAGLMLVSNILKDEPHYEKDDGYLTPEQLDTIQKIAYDQPVTGKSFEKSLL